MTIFKRKDKDGIFSGNYRICVYRGKDDNGKKLYHWETFDGTIKQARDRETQLKWEIKHGKYVKPGKLTLAEFLDKWLRDYSEPNMEPSTHRVYRQQANNHLKPHLGKHLLTNLTPAIISDYYSSRLKAGLSAQTVRHHRTMLHKALQTAIEWGLIEYNPVDGSTKLKVKKPEMQTFSTDESNLFLETAKKLEPLYYPVFVISLHAGIRRSEVLGLKWQDVDDLMTSISINRKVFVTDNGEVVFGTPKTQKSQRLIPLTPFSSIVLKEHYAYCKRIYKELRQELKDDMLVFCHFDTGKPFNPNTVTRAWSRIAKLAGLKHIRLHDARHTMATIMLGEGIHPKIVSERLGHSSINITLDLYSHVTPTMQEEAAKSLDKAFKKAVESVEQD